MGVGGRVGIGDSDCLACSGVSRRGQLQAPPGRRLPPAVPCGLLHRADAFTLRRTHAAIQKPGAAVAAHARVHRRVAGGRLAARAAAGEPAPLPSINCPSEPRHRAEQAAYTPVQPARIAAGSVDLLATTRSGICTPPNPPNQPHPPSHHQPESAVARWHMRTRCLPAASACFQYASFTGDM